MKHLFWVKLIKRLLPALLICLLPLNVCAREEIIKIGALANRGYDDCLKKWAPTAAYLTKRVPPYTFRIVPLSFEEINGAIQQQNVDFVICNPSIYAEMEALYGVGRIATVSNKVLNGYYSVYGGVIFTREDSGIHTLKDLKGKRFAAVDPDSLGGWLVAWRELNRVGINPSRDFAGLTFTGQHDKVVYAVLSGKVDAGAVRTDVLERMIHSGNIRLQDIRVLGAENIRVLPNEKEFPLLLSTRLYPEWPFAKLMKTPKDLATRIAVALMSMDRGDPAAVAADSGGWTYPMNYQPVHELMMELKVGYYGKLKHPSWEELLKKYWLEALLSLLLLFVVSGALVAVLLLNRRLRIVKKKLDAELVERGKIQAEIERSEEQYRLLIENLLLGVFVHTQGKIVYANPAFVTLFKASSPNDVIGMRLIDLVPPELFDTVEERERIMIEEKRPLPPLELNLRRMDGAVITVVFTPMPIVFRGQPSILTALHDITDRKRGEIELQKARKLLEIHAREIDVLKTRLTERAVHNSGK
jgi:phosphate/phosphite/phosphonate ABC transporter binding protein